MRASFMKHGSALLCAGCLFFGCAFQQQQAAHLLSGREKEPEDIHQDVMAALCAKIFIHFTINNIKDIELPVPAEQLERLKEILSHLQPVPPAMGERDGSHAYWLAYANLSFSDAEGKVSPFSGRRFSIICPESIMSETEVKKLSPDRSNGFYEASWYLPDDKLAEFNALPIVKQARELVDKMLKE